MLLISFILPKPPLGEKADAETAITSAKQQIVASYHAARDAERAGANITSLIDVLNDAGELLSRSELAYSMNDFDAARDFSVQCQERLTDFVSQANAIAQIGE